MLRLCWFLLGCCLWMAGPVGCSKEPDCRFDGDCSRSGAQCANGVCVAQERVSVERVLPDIATTEAECQDGHQRTCYSGSSGQRKGICKQGKQFCVGGRWGDCQGEILPKAKEECNDLDDNCNGTVDEGCNCKPGQEKDCYVGPEGTGGKGICRKGKQVCERGGQWGACKGSVSPTNEECDGKDNNCDGSIDEELFQDCYEGPANTVGVGVCQKGRKTCNHGTYGACLGQAVPKKEICNNRKDDDCDGVVDEGPGRALAFSGSGQSVTIPHHNSLNLLDSFTMELWYNFEGVGSKSLMILINKHKNGENTSGYHLKIQNPNNECALSWWKGNTGGLLKFGACPTKRWAHIAFVYEHTAQQYHFYIDGKRVKNGKMQLPLAIGANTFPLVLGTESGSTGTPDFRGKMAAIRISRVARYTGASFSPSCTFSNDSQTVGLWNLDDGGGTRVKDLSSNGNHGALSGATWDSGRSCNAIKPGEGCSKE